jgi:hypothetical protein
MGILMQIHTLVLAIIIVSQPSLMRSATLRCA